MPPLDRLERLTDLLLVLLDTSRPLPLREIVDLVPGYPEGGGARRQAFERDKRILRDEGVPIETVVLEGPDDQLGYTVDPGVYYLDLELSPDEQAALNLAVAGVHLGESTGQDALGKLGVGDGVLDDGSSLPLVDLPSPNALPALPALFDAIRREAAVTFTYRGEQRHLDGAVIRFRRGRWYVVGYDRDREAPRTFRVDRIQGQPEVGEPGSADPPADFDADAFFSIDPWQFGSGEEIEVDVLVDRAESPRVLAEVGEPAVVERRADGGVVVRLAVTDTDALVHWVLDFLDHAEVLSPPELRDLVVSRLEAFVFGETA